MGVQGRVKGREVEFRHLFSSTLITDPSPIFKNLAVTGFEAVCLSCRLEMQVYHELRLIVIVCMLLCQMLLVLVLQYKYVPAFSAVICISK